MSVTSPGFTVPLVSANDGDQKAYYVTPQWQIFFQKMATDINQTKETKFLSAFTWE